MPITAADLTKQIAKVDQDLEALNADVADLIAGKAPADELDAAIKRVSDAEARRAALVRYADSLKGQNQAAIKAAREEAAKVANKRALGLLPQLEAAAADLDSFVNGLVATIQRVADVSEQFRAEAFDAGLTDHNQRHGLTDLRAVSALLADRLNRSGVAQKLDYLSISTGTYLEAGTDLVDLVKARNAKLVALLKMAEA